MIGPKPSDHTPPFAPRPVDAGTDPGVPPWSPRRSGVGHGPSEPPRERRGHARLEDMDDDVTEINAVEEMGLRPWIPTLKYNVVEITPEQISGRGFEFGEEPERYVG